MKRIVVRHVRRRKIRNSFPMTLACGFMIGFLLGIILLLKNPYRLVYFSFREITARTLGSLPLHRNLTLAVDDIVAKDLEKQVRVFCFITTSPENHVRKARHARETWGKRCNGLMFGSLENSSLPSIALRGRGNWQNTKELFRYVNKNHLNFTDWVLIADDDTYVVVENLRHFLSRYNPSEAIYFGSRSRKRHKNEGAYVFSKAAVERFVNEVDSDAASEKCQDFSNEVDNDFSLCLTLLNIRKMDSRDSLGRGRFFQLDPEQQLVPREWRATFLFWIYEYNPSPEGLACCSDTAVAFHNVDPLQMYILDYFIYILWPYGIKQHVPSPNWHQTIQ